MDGTLVDSYPAIIESTNFTLRALGLPVQDGTTIRRAVGWGDKELLRHFMPGSRLRQGLALYRRHHKDSLKKKCTWMPGAQRLMACLRRCGYVLAIASNRPRRFLDIILRHLGACGYFSHILCKDQLSFGKPHPSILNKIIAAAGVPKEGVLYVGDMVVDVHTAQRAGVASCAVGTGSSSLQELRQSEPTFLFRDLSGLFSLLKN